MTTSASLSTSQWIDITSDMKAAAQSLDSKNPLLHGSDYNPDLSLHAIELMEPRLDGGADKTSLPSIHEQIQNQSLPLQTLTSSSIITIIDQLLQLYSSYVYGNSIPQTLYRNLYIHPTTIANLCTLIGIPVLSSLDKTSTKIPTDTNIYYKHAISPTLETSLLSSSHLRQVFPDNTVALPGEAPVEVTNVIMDSIKTLKTLQIGTSIHTLLTILLSSCLAMLKLAGISFEISLMGDIQREDDFIPASYGTDLAWNLSTSNILYLLRLSEYMLINSNTNIDNEVNNYIDLITQEREKSGTSSGNTTGGKTKKKHGTDATGKENTISATPTAPVYLSLDNVITKSDIFGEGVKPESSFYSAVLQQNQFESVVSSTSSFSASSPLSSDATLLLRLRYLRYYLITMYYVSPQNVKTPSAPLLWGRVFSLKDIYNSSVLAWDYLQSIRLTCPFLLDTTLIETQVPGYFPMYQRLYISTNAPRVYPVAKFSDVFELYNRHLSSLAYITQIPALVSHNPHRPMPSLLSSGTDLKIPTSTVTMQDLAPVARSLTMDDAIPIPMIRYSGLLDKPSAINTPNVNSPSGVSAPESISSSSSSTSAAPRPHISLHALWQILSDFLSRDADIIVRSFLRMVLISVPSAQALVAVPNLPLPSYQNQPGVPPSTDHWKYNQARSAVILGTHTLAEVIESSMQDVGISMELLASADGQRMIELLENIFSATLVYINLSPVRFHRYLEKNLSEWSVVLNEVEYTETLFRVYLEQRYSVLRENLLHPSTVSTEYDISKYTAFAPNDKRLMYILLRTVELFHPLYNWIEYYCLSLLKLYIRLGIESNLFHLDETLNVMWHLETVTKNLQRVQYLTEIGRVLHWLLPELQQQSEELTTILKKNDAPMLHRIIKKKDTTELNEEAENIKNKTAKNVQDGKLSLLQAEEESYLRYVNDIINHASGRRGTFRDEYFTAAEISYYAVLIRALVAAKITGIYSGLGVESCGLTENVESLMNGVRIATSTLDKWTPAENATYFRHPALVYTKRWSAFNEFTQLGNALSFSKYVATFAAPCTKETLLGLTNDAERFENLCVFHSTKLVALVDNILSNTSPASFSDTLKSSDNTKKGTKKNKQETNTTDNTKKGTKGNKVETTKTYEYVFSALSSFDVLMSNRDSENIRSISYNTDKCMRTLKTINDSAICNTYLTYRHHVTSAECAAWEAGAAKMAYDTKTKDFTEKDIKRLQIIATVAEKKLDNLEKSATENKSLSNITLPPRSSLLSPAVYDLLRIFETRFHEQTLQMKKQQLVEEQETSSESNKAELLKAIEDINKELEKVSIPRPAPVSALMGTIGNQKSLVHQISIQNNSILGIPTDNPLGSTISTPITVNNSFILPPSCNIKRGKYIISIAPPSIVADEGKSK